MQTIVVYSGNDIKKDGKLKKKNNAKLYDETNFFIYLRQNSLNISYGYVDVIGDVSNGLKFRCYLNYGELNQMIIGCSGLVKKFRGDVK